MKEQRPHVCMILNPMATMHRPTSRHYFIRRLHLDEVRERVHGRGAIVFWRYGQACGNFTPAGVEVNGEYFHMRG